MIVEYTRYKIDSTRREAELCGTLVTRHSLCLLELSTRMVVHAVSYLFHTKIPSHITARNSRFGVLNVEVGFAPQGLQAAGAGGL